MMAHYLVENTPAIAHSYVTPEEKLILARAPSNMKP